jgi:hypothetical protein
MPVNLAAIRDYLLPGLMSVQGKYKEWPKVYDKLFTMRKSKMSFERNAQNRYLGLAQIKEEGAQSYFDNNAGERWIWVQEHNEISMGYAITSKAVEDNLYEAFFQPTNLGLQKSFAITKEILGAQIFNTATTYNSAQQGDGMALLSTAHPVDPPTGTFANTPTVQVDLSESSLLNANIVIKSTFVDEAGLLINAQAKMLQIPPQLEPVAARLMKSDLRPGTADNDPNVIPIVAGGIKEYVVNPYLTSNFTWFVHTDVDGLLYLERIPFETSMWVDNVTDNLLVKGRERYSFGERDPRAIYGSTPTS